MDIREQIVHKFFRHICYLDNIDFLSHHLKTHIWRELSDEVQQTYYLRADQILAIKAEEDRECLNCGGILHDPVRYNYPCTSCGGKGKLPGRTLKQVLEEL